MIFYPQDDELANASLSDKLVIFKKAAEKYTLFVTDSTGKVEEKKRGTPRDLTASFNWDALAKLLRQIRDMSAANPAACAMKASYLTQLAEIYEILRQAKMPKLHAIRVTLLNEAERLLS